MRFNINLFASSAVSPRFSTFCFQISRWASSLFSHLLRPAREGAWQPPLYHRYNARQRDTWRFLWKSKNRRKWELYLQIDLKRFNWIRSYLMHLHAHKIIYRDFKTENILIDDCLYPRIADLGLSRNPISQQRPTIRPPINSQKFAYESTMYIERIFDLIGFRKSFTAMENSRREISTWASSPSTSATTWALIPFR